MSIQPKYGILSPEQQAAFDELLKDMPLYQPKRPELTGHLRSYELPEWWRHGQKVRTRRDGILTLNIAPDAEYWLTNDEGKEVYVFSADILGPVKNDAEGAAQ
ncbi:hypothetical protein [Enterobacter cloacae]|uniref:hypothetical protein n=1 Tax=Enterobacter cloacae TaxID=550 RepID=UPI002075C05F|nr:hypothetical protein [Enterobacter cloacae]MCM7134494.1 hypothetical protein [Enterobacter cloacae]